MSKPDYIDRYDYGREGVVYMESPAFITGADRYVPATENERLRAALTEIVRMYDSDDDCGDLDAADLAEIARFALSSLG